MDVKISLADNWVASPLRNSIKIELNVPINDVWRVIANPVNIFSNCCGVNAVKSKIDDSGKCIEYTINYNSEGGDDMVARSTMVWYEPCQGWASLDNDPHPMGFKESLLLITIEQKEEKSVLNWSMHYDIENDEILQMFIIGLEQLLKEEIAQLFIQKFGGRIVRNK